MKLIKKDEYVFSIDLEKTQKYYKAHSTCECAYCLNYYKQIKNKFPKLNEFLNEFGVDISKPDNITSVETDKGINYISVDYTVCRNIKEMGTYEIDIYDELFISIVITNGFVSPNEQTGEYFTISVMQIELPWVLDIPIPKTLDERTTKSKRIFKHFKK